MIVALLALLFSAFSAIAEPAAEEPKSFTDLIRPTLVQGVLELPFYSFYLGAPNIKGVAYLPTFGPRLGPKITWKDLGTTLTFALPIPKSELRRRGAYDQRNILIDSYWRQNAILAYYQRFRGFYVASPFSELSTNRPERYPQLPDASAVNYGVNWVHAFNPERYSLKAAFSQSEIQLRSGGSWLVAPFYNHRELSLGGQFVAGTAGDSIPEPPILAAGKFDAFGSSGGYGYTWIVKHFFATAQGAWGPGIQFQTLNRTDGSHFTRAVSLALKLNIDLAMGWNDGDYIGGIKAIGDSLYSKVADTQFSSTLVSAQAFFGRRF